MSRPGLSQLVPLPLLALCAALAVALVGPGGAPAAAPDHAGTGARDVTFRNQAEAPIECSLPSFQGGKEFQVPARGDYDVAVGDLSDVELVDRATCAGQTVSVVESSLESGHLTFEYSGGKFTSLGYFYIHAHLVSGLFPDCYSTSPTKREQYWAETAAGFCRGAFLGGSAPYDRTEGITTWNPVPGGAINVKMATRSGTRTGVGFECLAANRGSGSCYTDAASDQKAPAGQPGGPLSLDVQNDRNGLRYVLLRGYCANSNRHCLPH